MSIKREEPDAPSSFPVANVGPQVEFWEGGDPRTSWTEPGSQSAHVEGNNPEVGGTLKGINFQVVGQARPNQVRGDPPMQEKQGVPFMMHDRESIFASHQEEGCSA